MGGSENKAANIWSWEETKGNENTPLRFHSRSCSFPARFDVARGKQRFVFLLVSLSFLFVSCFPPIPRKRETKHFLTRAAHEVVVASLLIADRNTGRKFA